MIALITGRLVEKEPNQIIVDVSGVGYELTIPLSTWYEIGDPGSEVTLRVQTHVREDALQLFGFRTEREKRLFLSLTSVTGIGPKLAITVLSGMGADDLARSIHGGDLGRLVKIPGVGRKTAERMVVELKEKMQPLLGAAPAAEAAPGGGVSVSGDPGGGGGQDLREDAVSALLNLGYAKQLAEKAVEKALEQLPEGQFAAILRLSLRNLAR